MDAVSLLSKMVSYDTVNSNISGVKAPESGLSHFLEQTAIDLGFITSRLPVPGQCDDLLISYERDESKPWILFDSHLDTVSVDGMTVDPFAATVSDRKLYGRGACDTKGSGAAMLCALAEYAGNAERVAAAGSESGNNVMLMYSVDEEMGMTGIRSFVETHLRSLNREIIGAIVGEPTGLRPVVAHNGVQRYRIGTQGTATHSADPSRGHSAISDMAKLIVDLESLYIPTLDAKHELTGKAQCSINVIRGGSAVNIIPERCEIDVDRRTVPGESPREVVEDLEKYLDQYSRSNPNIKLDFHAELETPPLTPKEDKKFIDDICAILVQAGRDGEPVGVRYATHAGDLCVAGVTCVVLGPGSIDQGHTKDEWIDVSELEAAVPLYLKIMQGTDSYTGE